MRVAVLGSGNGGSATAFDFASHGHEVRLFDFEEFPTMVAAVAESGGIAAEGDMSGFAPIVYSGHDIARALDGAEMIIAAGPAYSTAAFAEACRPFLRAGQIVVVCPSSCGGALEFKRGAGHGIRDDSVVVAETATLPYAVRIVDPGRIFVYLKLRAGIFLAAVPSRHTAGVLSRLKEVYPGMIEGPNVMFTSLQNANPVIHPVVTIANVAQIERSDGDLLFYEEGVTPSVGRLLEAVDGERVALGAALNFVIRRDPDIGREQGYMSEATYYPGYSCAPGFKGVKAQGSLDHRYFNEDAGYGLVFLQSLGRQLGVATPTIDAVLEVASKMVARDYVREGKRTMESLGLAHYSSEELVELLA